MDTEQEWQQPNRPMMVKYSGAGTDWVDVLFIRATSEKGWEAINRYGTFWDSTTADLMYT